MPLRCRRSGLSRRSRSYNSEVPVGSSVDSSKMVVAMTRRRSFLFLLGLATLLACKPGAPKELKTQDGKFSLTVPSEWVTATGLSEEASIQARNGERYVTLTSIAREDSRHPSIDAWAAARAEKVRSNFIEGKLSPAENVTVGDRTF